MKHLDKVTKLLPNEASSMHTMVCIFHCLVQKSPTKRSVLVVKSYIEKQITYEELQQALKLK